jgi:2-methylcitrate dehydratase PrpD
MTDTGNSTISKRFASFITNTSIDNLPQRVVRRAKLRILDSLATAIAGKGLPVPSVALAFVCRHGGTATVIGQAGRVPAVDAALVNATLVNGRTQDDFLQKSHAGAISVPAALATAEEFGGTGADVLSGVVVGYDLVGRVYLGGPTMLPFFRATGVAGTVGAAATAAKVLNLDAQKTASALGLSAVFACGFGAGFLTGTMDVKLNVGMASRNGVTAAILAKAGATASELEFEGQSGFYQAFARSTEHAGRATEGLGERFLLEETIYKEYPICIFVQTPVVLTLKLRDDRQLQADKIAKVTVTASEPTYTNPGFLNVAPFMNQLKARISARFCIAAALLHRPIQEFAFYDEHHDDPEIVEFTKRIDLVMDPAAKGTVKIEIQYGDEILSIEGSEGETLFPTEEKIVAKFKRLTAQILGPRTDYVIDDVLNLESIANIDQLMQKLRP